MIYTPNGAVAAKNVVDGSGILEEFYNAYRVASQTSQWQWKGGAFADIASFDPPAIIATEEVPVTYIWSGTTDLSSAGSPDLSFGADRWIIPYNTSYQEVGDGDVALEWTSEYQELVLCAFSFQYVRDPQNPGLFVSTLPMDRLKVQISIDGVEQAGTGPYTKGENAGYPYGSGSQERSIAQTVVCLSMLGAGSHRVSPVAALSDNTSKFGGGGTAMAFEGPREYTQIGNRRLIVIRFPKSSWMVSG